MIDRRPYTSVAEPPIYIARLVMPSQGPHNAPSIDNLRDPEKRLALAALLSRLLERWRIDPVIQKRLLGLTKNSGTALACSLLPENEDAIIRAGHLLAIHESLRVLYPDNPEIVDGWLTHRNELFTPTPLEYMIREGLGGLAHVRRHLDRRRYTR